jgi:solute carrier family 27 fatty acid transporter 1/4
VATVGCLAQACFGVTPDDVLYTALPLYHTAGGLLGTGTCILGGCTMVVTRKFSARRFFQHCVEYDVTVTQYIGELCRYVEEKRRMKQKRERERGRLG